MRGTGRVIRELAVGFHVKRNPICATASSALDFRGGRITLCDIILCILCITYILLIYSHILLLLLLLLLQRSCVCDMYVYTRWIQPETQAGNGREASQPIDRRANRYCRRESA